MQPTCNIALKEWAAVCAALASGRQTLILRKGGIADDLADVRRAPHRGFWLYPTRFHERAESMTDDAAEFIARAAQDMPPPGQIAIRLYAELHAITELTTLESAQRLSPFHIYSAGTVQTKYDYREPGLTLFMIRMFALPKAILIPESPDMSGCKSWVTLPEGISTDGLTPVLGDDAFLAKCGDEMAALA